MSCVDLMAATTAKESREGGRRGEGGLPLPLLITAAACRHCCQFGRVFDSGPAGKPQERASERGEEEREGDSCGLAALWGVRGHSNCSRIIIFMAIVISELIAAALRHTHRIGARPLGGATVLKRICTYFRHVPLSPPPFPSFSLVGWPQQFLTGSSGKCGRQLLGLLDCPQKYAMLINSVLCVRDPKIALNFQQPPHPLPHCLPCLPSTFMTDH